MRALVLEVYLLQYKDPCLVQCRRVVLFALIRASGTLVRAIKITREVKYCTVQLVLEVVSNVVSYACML